jgi:hypothetical protein
LKHPKTSAEAGGRAGAGFLQRFQKPAPARLIRPTGFYRFDGFRFAVTPPPYCATQGVIGAMSAPRTGRPTNRLYGTGCGNKAFLFSKAGFNGNDEHFVCAFCSIE